METDRARPPSDAYVTGFCRRGLDMALRNRSIVSAYAVALALFLVIAAFVPGFATPSHIRFLLLTASFVGIVALGQTFVILGGGFDLSIPWTLTASASLMTALTAGQDAPLLWVLPLVLGGAAVVGLINGLGVTFLRVSPIIMTLSINVMIQGAVLLKFSGSTATSAPPLVKYLVNGLIGPLPIGVWLWLVIAALATVTLTFTAFGRRLYAVGTNAMASEFAGVNVAGTRIATYAISAICASIAGIMLSGFIGVSYLGFGDPFLFASVAAVAVGGSSVLGGHGHYLGTVAGALILTFLTGLLPILNLAQGWLKVVYGFSILLTVAIANLDRRQSN